MPYSRKNRDEDEKISTLTRRSRFTSGEDTSGHESMSSGASGMIQDTTSASYRDDEDGTNEGQYRRSALGRGQRYGRTEEQGEDQDESASQGYDRYRPARSGSSQDQGDSRNEYGRRYRTGYGSGRDEEKSSGVSGGSGGSYSRYTSNDNDREGGEYSSGSGRDTVRGDYGRTNYGYERSGSSYSRRNPQYGNDNESGRSGYEYGGQGREERSVGGSRHYQDKQYQDEYGSSDSYDDERDYRRRSRAYRSDDESSGGYRSQDSDEERGSRRRNRDNEY